MRPIPGWWQCISADTYRGTVHLAYRDGDEVLTVGYRVTGHDAELACAWCGSVEDFQKHFRKVQA